MPRSAQNQQLPSRARLTLGEYERPGERLTQADWRLRSTFLLLVERDAEHVLTELHELLADYGRVRTAMNVTGGITLRRCRDVLELRNAPGFTAAFGDVANVFNEFWSRLVAWQRKHRLSAAWILEHALATLDHWSQWPPDAWPRDHWAPYGHVTIAVPVLPAPSWAVDSESLDQYRRRVDEYIAASQGEAEGQGLTLGKWVDVQALVRRLRTLIVYQVDGLPMRAIARQNGSGWADVRREVRRAAAELSIQLRERSPGGRPRRRIAS